MFNAIKSGFVAVGKWAVTHKKIVVGTFLGICAIIGAALKCQKKDPEELLEAGDEPEALAAEHEAETEDTPTEE